MALRLCMPLALLLTAGVVTFAAFARAADSKAVLFARFQKGATVSYGIVEGDRIRALSGDIFGTWQKTDTSHALADVKLLAPTAPSKVLALAGNYRDHLGQTPVPEHPEIFFKSPTSVIPAGEKIVIPPGTADVHYEAEFVIVIGKRAKNVPAEKALDYVFGITCGNDVSARDWQKNDRQWWRATGSDTFGPCGPYVVSGINYDDLRMRLRQNGTQKQEHGVKDMIHGPAIIVSWISQHVTLEPGDLIFTGTSGKTQPIKAGDVVEVEIDGYCILKNAVEAAK